MCVCVCVCVNVQDRGCVHVATGHLSSQALVAFKRIEEKRVCVCVCVC